MMRSLSRITSNIPTERNETTRTIEIEISEQNNINTPSYVEETRRHCTGITTIPSRSVEQHNTDPTNDTENIAQLDRERL